MIQLGRVFQEQTKLQIQEAEGGGHGKTGADEMVREVLSRGKVIN